MTYSYTLTQDTDWQRHAEWQVPDTPFMRLAFWQALLDSGAIGEEAGWLPFYIVVHEETNKHPIAVMPVFIKGHHQGEYVFDHAWAEAYGRYGLDYYPRLVTSVPYTPVTGQRFWLAQGVTLNKDIMHVAVRAVDELAKRIGASSWHGLFLDPETVAIALSENSAVSRDGDNIADLIDDDLIDDDLIDDDLIEDDLTEDDLVEDDLIDDDSIGNSTQSDSISNEPLSNTPQMLERQGNQFLWHNQDMSNDDKPFASFDDFLATLTAKKRKNIRAERKKITKQGLSCRLKTGSDITTKDWEVFYQCYAMTYLVRGRKPYLSLAFFCQLGISMKNQLMLAQGLDSEGEIVASSLFFYDDPTQPKATLYGRYWGALEDYDSLHFELCYYQGIEFAIAQGLQYFDPGTQGEHKLIRGFMPTKTHSLHRIYDPRFEPAIEDFCAQDRAYMEAYRRQAYDALPFNIDNMPDFRG